MICDTHRLPGLVLTDHEYQVPLDHHREQGETITVFAREVAKTGAKDDLPWLVFFQGGPGFQSPRPVTPSGWLGRAVDDYRVLLLDQRGTGRSTPLSHRSLSRRGDGAAQADYLGHFRADGIVADAEWIRRELIGDRRWTGLGQSYGGFCLAHYLSAAPHGLDGVLITGGLPPLTASADDIYRRTFRHCRGKNAAYYDRYPGDVALVHRIAAHLRDNEVRLPCGDRLTVRRLQQLGLQFGMSDGFENVHYLLDEAFPPGHGDELSYSFLRHFESALAFDTNPIFAILHEPIYAQGAATRWSAERIRGELPEFADRTDGPLLFTGEMVFPWMFDEIGVLKGMADAAARLAERDDWPQLYEAATLAVNEVPAAAVIYANDMYVDRAYSEETASSIRGLKPWLTNEYEHNGLRADGPRILGRLLDLLHGKV